MGARATIRIIQPTSEKPIHLYTHWGGADIAETLAEGLVNASGRIDDPMYATRIIFDTLTGLAGGTTGFGIGIGEDSQPGDVEYDTPTVIWADYTNPMIVYRNRAYSVTEFVDKFHKVPAIETKGATV